MVRTRRNTRNRRPRRNQRRRATTDAGRDTRLPRMPITYPVFSEAPPMARSIESTLMKREMLRFNFQLTNEPTPITAAMIVSAINSLGLKPATFTIHRLLAYSLGQFETESYLPLVITHAVSGYSQIFYGAPGQYSPRGMVKIPPHLAGPVSATTVPGGNLFIITAATVVMLDVSIVSLPPAAQNSDSIEPISPFESVAISS